MPIFDLINYVSPWSGTLGAFFGLAGALLMASNVWLTKSQAIEIGFPKMGDINPEVMLNDPNVQGLLAQSLRTKIGIALLVLSFALQIWSSWPKNS